MVHRKMAILHHFYTNEMLHFRKVFEMAPPFPNEQALKQKRAPKLWQNYLGGSYFWATPLYHNVDLWL